MKNKQKVMIQCHQLQRSPEQLITQQLLLGNFHLYSFLCYYLHLLTDQQSAVLRSPVFIVWTIFFTGGISLRQAPALAIFNHHSDHHDSYPLWLSAWTLELP